MIKWPSFKTYLGQILPIILTQLFFRLFHTADLKLIGGLGENIRLVHAIQYNFTVFGQFLGIAGMTTILTLWARSPTPESRALLLNRIVKATFLISIFAIMLIAYFEDHILMHFGISESDQFIGRWYTLIGSLNMALFAWQLCLDGALLALKRQTITLMNTSLLLMGNLITDLIAVKAYELGYLSQQTSALLFVSGTSLWFSMNIFISYVILGKYTRHTKVETSPTKPDLYVWRNEVVISLIRSVAPLLFAFQIGAIRTLGPFLVTYQAALHLAYFAALPLQGGLPIAVRECSEELVGSVKSKHQWLYELILFALAPCVLLYLVAMSFGDQIIASLFSLQMPTDHSGFLPLFFLGCMIGQIGHVVSVPIRASLRNHFIVYCLIFSELFMNNVGIFVLNIFGLVTPRITGMLTVGYASVFLLTMIVSLSRIRRAIFTS